MITIIIIIIIIAAVEVIALPQAAETVSAVSWDVLHETVLKNILLTKKATS